MLRATNIVTTFYAKVDDSTHPGLFPIIYAESGKRYKMKSSISARTIVFGLVVCFIYATQAQASETEVPAPHSSQHGFHRDFGNAEKWVKKFDDPARAKWQKPDDVIKALKLEPNCTIADIGAGTGYFSLRIAKADPTVKVYAADVEPDMVDYMKKQSRMRSLPNHIALKISSDKPDLPKPVDLVLVVDTFHHIDDRTRYFKLLKEKLKANGRIAIIDFTAESPEGPPPEHRISKAEVEKEMKEAGYRLDQDIKLLPYQYFLTFKVAVSNSGSGN